MFLMALKVCPPTATWAASESRSHRHGRLSIARSTAVYRASQRQIAFDSAEITQFLTVQLYPPAVMPSSSTTTHGMCRGVLVEISAPITAYHTGPPIQTNPIIFQIFYVPCLSRVPGAIISFPRESGPSVCIQSYGGTPSTPGVSLDGSQWFKMSVRCRKGHEREQNLATFPRSIALTSWTIILNPQSLELYSGAGIGPQCWFSVLSFRTMLLLPRSMQVGAQRSPLNPGAATRAAAGGQGEIRGPGWVSLPLQGHVTVIPVQFHWPPLRLLKIKLSVWCFKKA